MLMSRPKKDIGVSLIVFRPSERVIMSIGSKISDLSHSWYWDGDGQKGSVSYTFERLPDQDMIDGQVRFADASR